MIRNETRSDIDWNTLEDSSTLHRILWIQRFRAYIIPMTSNTLVYHRVGGLYLMD